MKKFAIMLLIGVVMNGMAWTTNADAQTPPNRQALGPQPPRKSTSNPGTTKSRPRSQRTSPRDRQLQPAQRQATQARPNQPRLARIPNRQQARLPDGFPLNPQEQKRIDAILRFWEFHTAKLKTFQCKFVRQNFDRVFGPKDKGKEKPISADIGTIRYAAPDKGLMRVDQPWKYDPREQKLKRQELQFGEYWVCDGTSVYQFDSRTKTLTETQLPPDMQGKGIGDGPLPFLFGAKAERMKQRYWIRDVTPSPNPAGDYWLEATPKKAVDAANFDRLIVILAKPKKDNEPLTPKSMKVFNKQGYMIYDFKEHRINDARDRVAGFLKAFVRPSVPNGWTKVVEDWNGNRIHVNGKKVDNQPIPALSNARRKQTKTRR